MPWGKNLQERIVIDSGSYTIRIGTAASIDPTHLCGNFMAIDRKTGNKIFGPQLDNMLNQSDLIYEKNNVRGVTVRFESYVTMLDELMTKMQMPHKTTGFYCEDYSVTLPVLPYHPRKIMERHMEIYLEYYRYDAIAVRPSSSLIYQYAKNLYNEDLQPSGYNISAKYAVVVQSSQSATYITPFLNGQPVKHAIKRLDVGGKLLTNYLKEILSFRHLDLKNSDQLIKQIKEDLCYVSLDLMNDMRCKKGTFLKHFVLPDDQLKKKGYAVDILDENIYTQNISLDKERFQIPEILFNPQDIGLEQKGLSGAILEAIRFADESIRHNFLENIIITGGNTLFPNFNLRLYEDIKKNSFCWMTPRIYTVNQKHALFEAAVFASRFESFPSSVILKEWYREQGANRINSITF